MDTNAGRQSRLDIVVEGILYYVTLIGVAFAVSLLFIMHKRSYPSTTAFLQVIDWVFVVVVAMIFLAAAVRPMIKKFR